jgi:hypothetical protein
MGSSKICICGNETFRVYKNDYTAQFFKERFMTRDNNHLEIVCTKCGRGVCLFEKYLFDDSIHFKDKQNQQELNKSTREQ